ncbi:MAG: hypothetical protein WAX04_06610 [Oscillospiraceae bacterium]
MRINMDCNFMQIGITLNDLSVSIPFPSNGKGAFETIRYVESVKNANGTLVSQQIGRSVDKQNLSWSVMDATLWWKINNFIETNGMAFYCRYFSHNLGRWNVRKFTCSDFQCEPYQIDVKTGVPEFYVNCSFNVIDTGEV